MRRVFIVLIAGISALTGSATPAVATPPVVSVLAAAATSAVGSLDAVTRSQDGTRVRVAGWALDPNASSDSSQVHVYVGDRGTALLADGLRSDVNAALRVTGQHGFELSVGLNPGSNQVCAYAISSRGVSNTVLGCRAIQGPTNRPARGSLDSFYRSADGREITLAGWVLDPNATSATAQVHVYVGAVGSAWTADRPRADVNLILGVEGQHGFSATVDLVPGRNQVCAFAISVTGGGNTALGCGYFEGSSNKAVVSSLDILGATSGGESARVAGWAYDPNAANGIAQVRVETNGSVRVWIADQPRPDVNAALGVTGPHGFDGFVSLKAGANEICIWAVSTVTGGTTRLGCRTVIGKDLETVTGSLDVTSLSADGTQVTVAGWALDRADPSLSSSVEITTQRARSSNTPNQTRVISNQPRNDVNRVLNVPGDHGFLVTVPVLPETTEVCIWAQPLTVAWPRLLGCQEVEGRYPDPTVSDMVPTVGNQSQETEVAIRGRHLLQTQGVMFGSAHALSVRQVTDELLMVTAPALPTGAEVPVTVIGAATSVSAPLLYSTSARPSGLPAIEALSPDQGHEGTALTITGHNLADIEEVWFVGSGAPSIRTDKITVLSDNEIRLPVPAIDDLQVGSFTISLITRTGAATSARMFSFSRCCG